MFKLKITHAGREIEIEVPLRDGNSLEYNSKAVLEILKEAVKQIIELNI